MPYVKVVLFYLILATAQTAHAFTLDGGVFYLSDSLSISSDTTHTRMFVDVAITIDLDKKGNWVAGWSYGIIQAADSSSSEVSFSLTEMGPVFGYYFDKSHSWPLFLVYNLQATATYDDGTGTSSEWRGSSYRASFGYRPMIFEGFNGGLFINYYSAAFGESLTGSTTFATISNSRSIIYPSITFSYRF